MTLPDLSSKALELGHHIRSDYTALRIPLVPQLCPLVNWGTQQGGFPKQQKTCGDWRGYVRLFRAPATLTVRSAFFPTASLVVMGKTAALREPAPEEAAGSTGRPAAGPRLYPADLCTCV